MQNSVNELQAWCQVQLQRQQSIGEPSPQQQQANISLQALRVEASHRHFYRIQTESREQSWVAMWSPPELENNPQFVALAEVFAGLGTPNVLAQDQERGFFLMEDLGETHLIEAYQQDEKNPLHLAQCVNFALDALLPFQQVKHPAIPAYDGERLVMEFDLCAQWLVEGLMTESLGHEATEALASSRQILVDAMLEQPQVCVHRDYHCRNLLITGNGPTKKLGIVDFQDALVGPALYDPASLLRDCYYTHDGSLIADCLTRFANHSPELTDISPKTLTWWLDACAIQRQLKAIGIFARLHLRDGKSSHLGYIVPTLGRLTVLTKLYPELSRLNALLSAWSSAARQLEVLNRESPS